MNFFVRIINRFVNFFFNFNKFLTKLIVLWQKKMHIFLIVREFTIFRIFPKRIYFNMFCMIIFNN